MSISFWHPTDSLHVNWSSHCRLSRTACNCLECTVEDFLDTTFLLWIIFNWFHLEESLHWWLTATQEEEQIQEGQREDHWSPTQHWWGHTHHHWQPPSLWLTAVILLWCSDWALLCWLNYTNLESRFTEDVNTCTLHHVGQSLFMSTTDCVLPLILIDFASLRSLHVLYRMWHWFTGSMSRGSATIYMHCTHTTAHSTILSSSLTAWLKSPWKRQTEFTLDWLKLLTVSCTEETSQIFAFSVVSWWCFQCCPCWIFDCSLCSLGGGQVVVFGS